MTCPHIVTDDEGTSHCTLAQADDAELAELRALKAKVDACSATYPVVAGSVVMPFANQLLAWLREPTE